MKNILNISLLLTIFLFLSCKKQVKESKDYAYEKPKNKISLIDREFTIDQESSIDDLFKSKNLDRLFKRENYLYIIGEYSGTSKDNYHCKIIGLFKNNVYEKSYVLFFDNNDVLRDTLDISKKDVSLDVLLENNEKGIATGEMDAKNLYNPYFYITNLYTINLTTIKLKSIDINTKILKCEFPIEYLSEEYVGMEDYFKYGIQAKPLIQNNKTKKTTNSK